MLTDQTELFSPEIKTESYQPRPAPLFRPRQIILAKGSLSTPQRKRMAEGICAAYPSAPVVEQLSVPHNKVSFDCTDPLELRPLKNLLLPELAGAKSGGTKQGGS